MLIDYRYEIHETLGQGGMGVVYRAVDRMSGTSVALKKVIFDTKSSIMQSLTHDTDFRIAITREFQTLAGLRHPNLISVLEYGFDADQLPYFTMSLLQDAQDIYSFGRHLKIEGKVGLLIQLLQGLAYVHRQGVVHRDVKPSNILVSKTGQVRILDFGLATIRAEGDRLAGTLAYMPPEILGGEAASTSSDLYAVGVIAYELLVGQHPYDLSNKSTLIRDILNKTPDYSTLIENFRPTGLIEATTNKEDLPIAKFGTSTFLALSPEDVSISQTVILSDTLPPPEKRPDYFPPPPVISVPLVNVLDRLMAKQPSDRYQHAQEVIEDLCRAIGLDLPEESHALRDSYLHAAKFVGREIEMQVLTSVLKSAVNGRGSAWLIGGESGVGKTRLMNELAIEATVSGVLVLRGQAILGGGIAYQLWRGPLRRLVLSTDLEDQEAAVLKEVIPSLDLILKRPIYDSPLLESVPGAKRLINTVVKLFQNQSRPMLLLMEDLHWSVDSLDILRALNMHLEKLPLLIVGSYRNDEAPNLPNELPNMQLIKLARLSDDSIAELSYTMLGEAGRNQRVVDFLKAETEGNAFFLVELVRSLAIEAGSLQDVGKIDLPQESSVGRIQELINHRLRRVPDSAREYLKLAALLGRRFDWAILQAVDPTMDWDEWFARCKNLAVLDIQEGRVGFAHEKLYDSVLSQIQPEEIPTLHRWLAEAIERTYPHNPEYAARLCEHWELAGEKSKAFEVAQQAATYFQQNYSPQKAIHYLERTQALYDDLPMLHNPATELFINSQLGEALYNQSRYGEAQNYLEKALLIADKLSDENQLGYLRLRLGMVAWLNGDYALSESHYQVGLSRISAESNQLRARLLNRSGLIQMYQGNHEAALRLLEESLGLAMQSGDMSIEANTLTLLGNIAVVQGDLEAAQAHFQASLERSRKLGDQQGIANITGNLGVIAMQLNDYESALQHQQECLRLNELIGNQHAVANTLTNMGHIYRQQEEKQLAKEIYRQALELARKLETPPLIIEIIAGLACLQDDKETQLAWFDLVMNHPATYSEAKQIVEAHLPTKTALAGKDLDLEAVMRQILG